MKRSVFFAVLIFCYTSTLIANSVKIGNLYYVLDERNKTAEVTKPETGAYSGRISIPSTIKYKGGTYRVISIGENAFRNSSLLLEVTIEDGIANIGKNAFWMCKGLKEIRIPHSVTNIDAAAFVYCEGLTTVDIPSSVTNIGEYSFKGCSVLKNIEIPTNVPKIGAYTFADCISLKKITIPYGVLSIDEGAFSGCTNMESISIPNTTTSIGKSAFSKCRNLTSISIPTSVKSIGSSAFAGCSGLQHVIVPNSVTSIGDFAFGDCKSLTSVYIPNSVVTIGYCFGYSQPENLKEIYYEKGFDITKISGVDRSICKVADSNITFAIPVVTSTPPNLAIVDGSVVFTDNTQNNRIDANEQCAISFKVQNLGKGAASGCVATVRMTGDKAGVIANNVSLNTIAAGATEEIKIPVSSNIQTTTGQVTFTIEVTEPNGFGADPFELSVNTKAYEPPYLQIVDYAVTGAQGGTLVKKQPFNLQLMLQNTKYGTAENVEVELQLPGNVYLLEGERKVSLATLDGGKAQSLDYQLVVTNNYEGTSIPVNVRLKEKYGKYAEDRSMTLQLNQNLASSRLTVKAAEEDLAKQEIQLASIGSAVDKNIPVSKIQNKNTFAVIIANENYQQVASVPFALNDGSVFRQYCEKTLGIPATNIHFVANATGNNIRYEVNWLSQVIRAYNGQAKIIFYYAGHGVPDEQNKTAFLLPVDGNGSDITTGYKLDDLYSALGNMPSEAVTVFLDACFSGSKRESGMLASARGVAIKVKSGAPVGKMVVFTAATGDETAYPNNAEGHGMFTYYLLKKLQETSGEVSYEELGNYIRKNVSQQSIVLNGKSQTPTIIPSSQAADWQNWKLK